MHARGQVCLAQPGGFMLSSIDLQLEGHPKVALLPHHGITLAQADLSGQFAHVCLLLLVLCMGHIPPNSLHSRLESRGCPRA